MKTLFLIFTIFLANESIYSITFLEAIERLKSHTSIQVINGKSDAIKEQANIQGSWGDPKFRIAAKNFPRKTLNNDETPMTGIEFGISQNISLTNKYGDIEKSINSLAQATALQGEDRVQMLSRSIWEIAIIKRKITNETKIIQENIAWTNNIFKISKKLYANGKISQQALLDIQIRKSELEGLLSNKSFELLEIEEKILYLIPEKLDFQTIPWKILETPNTQSRDVKELALKQHILSKELNLSASKKNFVSDINLSFGYTKRANIDSHGDFIGVAIAFPIPLSGKKYSGHQQAVKERYVALKEFEDYKNLKARNVSVLQRKIEKMQKELEILTNSTIKFARNSLTITSKSYGLGRSTYTEVLQSELKLQNILLKEIHLKAQKNISLVTLKYLLGESLYE
ncbi:TolC family protein [Bacteriovoracaceae bacterium]|nr:TolC family protein [Bacteriovoracaceae bacterium]